MEGKSKSSATEDGRFRKEQRVIGSNHPFELQRFFTEVFGSLLCQDKIRRSIRPRIFSPARQAKITNQK